MRPQIGAVLLTAVLYGAICSLANAAPANPRAAIAAVFNRQNKCAAQKDIQGFMDCLAPDFTVVLVDKTVVNRDLLQQNILNLFLSSIRIAGQTTIQTFALKAGKAYVRTKEHDEVVITNPLTQQPTTIVDDEIDTSVWRQVGGSWEQESQQVLTQQQFRHHGALNFVLGQAS